MSRQSNRCASTGLRSEYRTSQSFCQFAPVLPESRRPLAHLLHQIARRSPDHAEISARPQHFPIFRVSYEPIVLPVRSSSARISPATCASSPSNRKTLTGPCRNLRKASAFSTGRELLCTPYHRSEERRVGKE